MMRRVSFSAVLVLSQLLAGRGAAQDAEAPTPPPAAPVPPTPPAAPVAPVPDVPAAPPAVDLSSAPTADGSATAILELEHTQASEIGDLLSRLFKFAQIEPIPSSNWIVVRALPQDIKEISVLIGRLEEQAPTRGPRVGARGRAVETQIRRLQELAERGQAQQAFAARLDAMKALQATTDGGDYERALAQLEAAQAEGTLPMAALIESAHADRQRSMEAKSQYLAEQQETLRESARNLAAALKEQRRELGDDHQTVAATREKIEELVKQAHQMRFREQEAELDRLKKRLREVERELKAYRERVDELIPREVERLIQSAAPEEEEEESKDLAR